MLRNRGMDDERVVALDFVCKFFGLSSQSACDDTSDTSSSNDDVDRICILAVVRGLERGGGANMVVAMASCGKLRKLQNVS